MCQFHLDICIFKLFFVDLLVSLILTNYGMSFPQTCVHHVYTFDNLSTADSNLLTKKNLTFDELAHTLSHNPQPDPSLTP